ncbi:hypothetical protein Hanom_Chr09g00781691 [Helianthus anomalus]
MFTLAPHLLSFSIHHYLLVYITINFFLLAYCKSGPPTSLINSIFHKLQFQPLNSIPNSRMPVY